MNQRFLDQTYYELLEISADAGEHEIHRAYQRAKETYSPDSPALYTMFSPEEANELTRLIEEAYSVLSNLSARREYDSRVLGKSYIPKNAMGGGTAKVVSSPGQRKAETKSSTSPSPKAAATETAKDKVPEGYSRTKYGVYELQPEFENKISTCESFDGEMLKQIRNYKKIPLDGLSEQIRVSRPFLMAIETNDYEALPADVFVRGFIVQYAKAMGLNHEKVASSYMKILRAAKK